MYEFHTKSVFDTFTGEALSGPLREEGVRLELISTRTSTWADWKAAHPDTTIVAEDGGIGRRYLADPLQGRDDFGPIFPIGDVDPRLPGAGTGARCDHRRRHDDRLPRCRGGTGPRGWRAGRILRRHGSSPTVPASAPRHWTATRSPPTRPSGSPGANSTRRRSCGRDLTRSEYVASLEHGWCRPPGHRLRSPGGPPGVAGPTGPEMEESRKKCNRVLPRGYREYADWGRKTLVSGLVRPEHDGEFLKGQV